MPQHYRKSSLSTTSAYPKDITSRRKRWRRILIIGTIAFLTTIFTYSPAAPPRARQAAQRISPFKKSAHKPPTNDDDGLGEASWSFSSKWLHPFSDSINSEDDRVVLPPSRKRTPIYAYYDISTDKDEALRDGENKLLLIWRRAWWAQGFKPVILGKADAKANELYKSVKELDLEHALEIEMMRWLAWGHMGTGILSNWLVLPMGPREDPVLSYLRSGALEDLHSYKDLAAGLFSGHKDAINSAIQKATKSAKTSTARSVIDIIPSEFLKVEPNPASIAFYDSKALTGHYKSVSDKLSEDKPAGLKALRQLIIAHLHLNFLNTFSAGIAVLSPFAAYTKVLNQWALTLAHALVKCPPSPIPDSCPPNNLKCFTCSTSRPLHITRPETFSNTSSMYTIGTVPHPYTLAALRYPNKEITVAHVRRNTPRDAWLEATTEDILGTSISGYSRISPFKETVASDWGIGNGFWITEDPKLIPDHKDIEWHFGFPIPHLNSSEVLIPLNRDRGAQRELELQQRLFDEAKGVIRGGKKKGQSQVQPGVREVTEAWNLADTEAWRFVRSLGARERQERKKWEDEERDSVGKDDEGKPSGWGRWFDR